jgi:nucleoside-diphosphate-sugar epimerase
MILVTGVNGFIGKHLLEKLISLYGSENVLALTSKPISNCNYLIHDNYLFDENFFIINGYNNITTIIHAGAFTPKNQSESNNIKPSNSNIYNTQRLINSNLPKLEKIIFLSTLDVYRITDEVLSEDSVVNPISLYGFSKLYCEKMLENYCQEKKLQIQILRIGHVFGPGEEQYQKIIPNTIKNILNNKNLTIFGDGTDIRSFIYIDDVINAIINSIKIEENLGVVNVVSGNSITIKELVNKIISISGKSIEINYLDTGNGKRNLKFNNSKLKNHLLDRETDIEHGLLSEFNYMKTSINEYNI